MTAATKTVRLLYGREGMTLRVPAAAEVLTGRDVAPLPDPDAAVAAALARPIGCESLAAMLERRRPGTVAVTVSDSTRPAGNRAFLPAILDVLNRAGVADSRIVIVIGTGMHRPSTAEERLALLGEEMLSRVEVIDHTAERPETLVEVCDDPPVRVCRRFAEAEFRIVTGFIEPHFMAGFSGGRKGVCPALVDLETIQRFHGFDTLADPKADSGVLEGNPCHEIALGVARTVGVDFLFNVAITRDHRIAGVYCGDLVEAHLAGCRQVAEWTTATVDAPYDVVITTGGGFPLDQTFYQTVKGICAPLAALHEGSTLLAVSHCGQGVGSAAYEALMRRWNGNWRGFLTHIEASRHRTERDQWELQVQTRVLKRIGPQRLLLVTDGIPPDVQRQLSLRPVLGPGDARERAQGAIDDLVAAGGDLRIAVLPDGPYTMLRRRSFRPGSRRAGTPRCSTHLRMRDG